MMRRIVIAVAAMVLMHGVLAQAQPPVAIALHGGAGTITAERMTPELAQAYHAILDEAVALGHARLRAGAAGDAVVVEVIQLLEASPLFNAGVGAVFTWDGLHELDASIMHGRAREAGAVAGVRTVASPIALAARVMTHSPHVLLTGAGAEAFAVEQGFPVVDNASFSTEARRSQWRDFRARADAEAALQQGAEKFGTVGVTVLDSAGNLVAGTSTGGMTGKRFGRVGDSPIIGAGTWADNATCAVSATGHGEYFIRYQVAADICARMRYRGISLDAAATQVVLGDLVSAGGEGGIVAVDASGSTAMVFNTAGMYRASIDADGRKVVAIYSDTGADTAPSAASEAQGPKGGLAQ